MIKVRSKIKPPELKLVLATAKTAVVSDRRKGFEIPFSTTEAGEVKLAVAEEIDPDAGLGQQISAWLGKDISNGLSLEDFNEKQAYLLLAAKRGSGGRYVYAIEAVLAPDMILSAAEAAKRLPTP